MFGGLSLGMLNSVKTAFLFPYARMLSRGLGCITPKPGDNVWLYLEGTLIGTQTSSPLLTTIIRTITSNIPDPSPSSVSGPTSLASLP
jgi:hypothetical protein